MRKTIILLWLLMVHVCVIGQCKKYYCEIKGIEKELSSGLKIVFDFGNNPIYNVWGGLKGNQKLVNEKGEEIPFNSMVDAGNYMSEKGWTFLHAYSSVYGSNVIVHWIFLKEAESPEKAIEGIMTKEMFKHNQKQ